MDTQTTKKQKDGESRPLEALVMLLIIASYILGFMRFYTFNQIYGLIALYLALTGFFICSYKLNLF